MKTATRSPPARAATGTATRRQVLLAEKGRLRTQEQGKPVLELRKAAPCASIRTSCTGTGPAHGAGDSGLAELCPTNWMAKVTDQETP